MEMKKRIAYIDNLKAFAILLVVLGHVLQYIYCPLSYKDNSLFTFIYSFHMPLFMFISGYTACVSNVVSGNVVGGGGNFVLKRMHQLMLPFFSWTLLMAALKGSPELFLKVILKPDYGLWFLWVLFFVGIIHHFIYNYIKDSKCRFFAIIAVYILLRSVGSVSDSVFGTRLIAIHLIYYSTGFAICKKIDNMEQRHCSKMVAVFGLMFFLLLIPYHWNTPVAAIHGIYNGLNILIDILYKIALSTSACLFFLCLFRMFGDKISSPVITILGRETLGIYVIHFTIIPYFRNLPYEGNFWFATLIFLTLVTVSLVAIKIIKKNHYLSFLLLGSKLN